jgi:lipopolysaccharide export LptBFGC system permease protein LptF
MKDEVISNSSLPPNGNSFMFRTFDDNHNLLKMIYISHYEGRKLGDSTFLDLSNPKVMRVIQAHSGTWDPQAGWELKNANVYLVSDDTEHSSSGHFETSWFNGLTDNKEAQEKRQEELQEKAKGIRIKSEQMTFGQLLQAIHKRETLHESVARSHYINLWSKLTWPVGCLAIALSAVPLALTPPRRGSKWESMMSLVVLFLFYLLNTVFQNIGRIFYVDFGGLLSLPVYLAIISWLPILLIALIGVVLIRRKSLVL